MTKIRQKRHTCHHSYNHVLNKRINQLSRQALLEFLTVLEEIIAPTYTVLGCLQFPFHDKTAPNLVFTATTNSISTGTSVAGENKLAI